ncbi:MAG: lysylphosphatidylglycerol synthase transmembrane domain-containing protein [Candidatus Methanoperedens sp.]|nr:lysylphosphatidylglycerol synthase transmembrane domain-containing protein [Candidatus Methanoperedens sp.]
MKKLRIFIQFIIGISIIIFILNKLDLNEVMVVIRETNITYFILACISYLFLNMVLAFRLSYLLKKIGHNIKYINVFLSHMGGMIVGDITPGRSGYFLTPPIMKKTSGVPITDGMACIFAPQGIEFILKVGGAAAALIFISTFPKVSDEFIRYSMIGAFLLLAVGIFMLLLSWHDENVSSKFLSKVPFLNNFTGNLSFFKEKSILIRNSTDKIVILYMIGWIFATLQWFFLAKAIGIEISFFAILLFHPLITILMFVPISPAGLGLMEGGMILVFSFVNITSATAMAFSVLVRINILLVDLIGLKTVMKASK